MTFRDSQGSVLGSLYNLHAPSGSDYRKTTKCQTIIMQMTHRRMITPHWSQTSIDLSMARYHSWLIKPRRFRGEAATRLLPCYDPSRPPRSSGTRLLTVPRVTAKHAELAFSCHAPHMYLRPTQRQLEVCFNSKFFHRSYSMSAFFFYPFDFTILNVFLQSVKCFKLPFFSEEWNCTVIIDPIENKILHRNDLK